MYGFFSYIQKNKKFYFNSQSICYIELCFANMNSFCNFAAVRSASVPTRDRSKTVCNKMLYIQKLK